MNFRLRTLTACLGLIGCAGLAHGSGFNLLEQNASGLGNAFAGSATSIENPSAMYFNPAALTQLEGLQISTGVNFVRPSFKFKDDGNSRAPRGFGQSKTALNGNGGDAGSTGIVPNFYISYKPTDRIGLGLGISAPFGLKTEYDPDWIGRYHSQSFDIKTININPAIAFKINDSWSVGAGLNIQRIEATYDKRNIAGLASVPGAYFDSGSSTKIKNTAYGWNVGIMFHPSVDTRIGLSYRSRIKHKADGHTSIDVNANAIKADATNYIMGLVKAGALTLQQAGALAQKANGIQVPTRLDSKATVSLPDMAVLSAYHRINEKWEVMGDISWIGWSSIPKLTINSVGGGFANETSLSLKFKDTWRVALGANYAVNEKWKLKMGVAWDQSPIRNAEHRPASLPDSDRYWVSLGVQYKPTQFTTIDVGYAHLFAKSSKIHNDNEGKANLYGRLSGSYKANANIFGLQVSHRFF
ncbi:OmpP1/FadL family transporter [Pelistega europaea]|uniref:Fatty acid transporter n=1 Tax=Pelistega europaea TaxID=106147 RepID=A0A7Y4LAZ0_9BURK|nr:outer membrane protein transport protein [Pelistega europaea]NOL49191.1 fatty acid transporter [Pelistega europaea]